MLITLIIFICTKFAKLEESSRRVHKEVANGEPVMTAEAFRHNRCTQTDVVIRDEKTTCGERPSSNRAVDECVRVWKATPGERLDLLSDQEVLELVRTKHIPVYKLEAHFNDVERAVELRRQVVATKLTSATCFANLPYTDYNYTKVVGSCCENVIGYVPVPLGVAGPLKIDGRTFFLPMATTEGTLVASTNRGCTALSVSPVSIVV